MPQISDCGCMAAFGCLTRADCCIKAKSSRDARRPAENRFNVPTAFEEEALTPQQLSKLAEFRKVACEDGSPVPQHHLLRFLRARKWDLNAALEQYQATQAWRREHDVDRHRRNAPGPDSTLWASQASSHPDLSCDGVECFPQLRLIEQRPAEGSWLYLGQTIAFGVDRQGRPIHLQRCGLASRRFRAMYEFAGKDPVRKIIDGYIRMQEMQLARMDESSASLGRRITKQVVIMDLEGLNFWPDARAIAVFKEFLMISQRYYPETLGLQFFVNAPRIFLALWKVIHSWLDPVTAEKMHILGSDYQSTLLEHIAPDQLPVAYGGTNRLDAFSIPQSMDAYESYFRKFDAAAQSLQGRKDAQVDTLGSLNSKPLLVANQKRGDASARTGASGAVLSFMLVLLAASFLFYSIFPAVF